LLKGEERMNSESLNISNFYPLIDQYRREKKIDDVDIAIFKYVLNLVKKGSALFALKTLALDRGKSIDTIHRRLSKLAQLGFIKWRHTWRCNRYSLGALILATSKLFKKADPQNPHTKYTSNKTNKLFPKIMGARDYKIVKSYEEYKNNFWSMYEKSKSFVKTAKIRAHMLWGPGHPDYERNFGNKI
jgi:hypothetical protein